MVVVLFNVLAPEGVSDGQIWLDDIKDSPPVHAVDSGVVVQCTDHFFWSSSLFMVLWCKRFSAFAHVPFAVFDSLASSTERRALASRPLPPP